MTEEQTDEPKNFILRSRRRVPVETTQGRFFARHMVVRDLSAFDQFVRKREDVTSEDFEEIGKRAFVLLVSESEADDAGPALDDSTLAALKPSDVSAIAHAILAACELDSSNQVNTLRELGEVLLESLVETAKNFEESSAAMKQTVEAAFGTLSPSVRASLGDKFSALSTARRALGTSAAFEVAKAAQERNSALFSTLGSRASAIAAAQQALQPSRALDTAMRAQGRVGQSISMQTSEFPGPIPNLDAFRPPKFEETAQGRTAARAASASEESARQLTELAGKIGTIADQMAGLQAVFLGQVLPEWHDDLEEGAKATRTTLRQAESSLSVAKWALVASVVFSVAMTGWQVWLAREYKKENDIQQERTEKLMREQLATLREMSRQLTPHTAEPAALDQSLRKSVVTAPPVQVAPYKSSQKAEVKPER